MEWNKNADYTICMELKVLKLFKRIEGKNLFGQLLNTYVKLGHQELKHKINVVQRFTARHVINDCKKTMNLTRMFKFLRVKGEFFPI